MSSGLTTATNFVAWGQAVYGVRVKRTQRSWNPSGLIVLFAIADKKREWLGWYYFNTTFTTDIILLGSTHEVLGEMSAEFSHFVTRKPMQVDELCGPIWPRAVDGETVSDQTTHAKRPLPQAGTAWDLIS
jgi:hypothetical protein